MSNLLKGVMHNSLTRINLALLNRSKIEAASRDYRGDGFNYGGYSVVVSDGIESFTLDLNYMACKNMDLFELDAIALYDRVPEQVISLLEGEVGCSIVDVLEYLAAKFVYFHSKVDSIIYPVDNNGFEYRGDIWLNPQRWMYLKYLKSEMEYFIQHDAFKMDEWGNV